MASDPLELITNLRDNADMLKDGLQLPNLTEAWHNVAMKHAAADSLKAAALISSLVAERDSWRQAWEDDDRDVRYFSKAMRAQQRAHEAERLLAEAREVLADCATIMPRYRLAGKTLGDDEEFAAVLERVTEALGAQP